MEALGWAFRNPSTTDPQTMPAEISVARTSILDGVPVAQLFSPQVAAGLRPKGFSGGPVLAGTLAGCVAVGVVRWMQPDDIDPTRAVGGTVYASPAEDIIARWPRLAPRRTVLEELAGEPGSPGRALVAGFLDTHLSGPGGTLPFAGRTAELAALDAWLADPEASAYHLISGGAGTGKSTLLTRWAETLARRSDPALHIVFVPVSLRYDAAGAHHLVHALVHRLARVHRRRHDPTAGFEKLRDTLSELLGRPAPPGTTVLVMVDALDEADGWEPGNLCLPRRPGKRVRIVLTARRTRTRATAQAWLESLRLDPGSATTLLGGLGEDAVAELLHEALPGNSGRTADILRAVAPDLWRLTRGDPVTTALYLQDLRLRSEHDLDRWTARLRQARPGLVGYVERWWQDQKALPDDHRHQRRVDDARCLFGLLALARGPLTEGELRLLVSRMLEEKVSGDRVRSALGLLDRFTLPGSEPASVALAHPLLAEVRVRELRESYELDEYRRAYLDWGRESVAALWASGPRTVTRRRTPHRASGRSAA